MATLQQTLRGLPKADDQLTRGAGGVLQRTPTLRQATQQAGLAAAPTTPMAAEMTGAGQQAAKMAGTPQQMQAALQQATEQPTLQTALRQKQYGREVTEAEAAAMSKSADMQKLGGLGDRVTKLIEAQKSSQLTVPTTTQGSLAAQGTTGTVADTQFEGKPVKGIAVQLEKLRVTDPITGAAEYNKLLKEINTYFGRTPTNLLTNEELNKLYKTSEEIMKSVSEGIQIKEPTVQEIIADPQFGYTLEQLSDLLNVSTNELATYTTSQLQAKVDQVASEEFSVTEQLEQQAMSPFVGAAERGLAREAARELSTIGVRAGEADMQRLVDDISSANVITFNNELYTIEQLVADDFISDIIKKYVDSPENSDFRKQLDEEEPQLSKFINTHLTALKTATTQMTAGVTQFGKIQQGNIDIFNKAGLKPDAVNILIPDSAGLQTSVVDPTKVNSLAYLNSLPEDERAIVSGILNDLATTNKDVLKEISTLTVDELTKLGIGKVGSPWAAWQESDQDRKLFARAGSPAEQLKFITDSTIEQINSNMAASKERQILGLPGIDISKLDVNKDGVPDWDKLAEVYNSINPKKSLKNTITQPPSVSKLNFDLSELTPVQESLITKFKEPIKAGFISAQNLLDTNLTLDEATELSKAQTERQAKIDPVINEIAKSKKDTPERFRALMVTLSANKYRNEIKHVPAVKGLVENYKQLGNYTDREYWKEAVNNQVVDWLKTSAQARTLNTSYAMYQALANEGLLSEAAINEFKKIYTNLRGTGKPLVYDQTLNKGLGGYRDW